MLLRIIAKRSIQVFSSTYDYLMMDFEYSKFRHLNKAVKQKQSNNLQTNVEKLCHFVIFIINDDHKTSWESTCSRCIVKCMDAFTIKML